MYVDFFDNFGLLIDGSYYSNAGFDHDLADGRQGGKHRKTGDDGLKRTAREAGADS